MTQYVTDYSGRKHKHHLFTDRYGNDWFRCRKCEDIIIKEEFLTRNGFCKNCKGA
jgi:formamidopyrimidine-DNA glycosylase